MARWTRPDRKHSIEAVKQIITAHPSETVASLAAELGMNNQTVRDIRVGKTYRDVLPEVERTPFWNRRGGCKRCLYYIPRDNHLPNNDPNRSARCQLNVPEFIEKAQTKGAKPGDTGKTCAYYQPKDAA